MAEFDRTLGIDWRPISNGYAIYHETGTVEVSVEFYNAVRSGRISEQAFDQMVADGVFTNDEVVN